MGPFAFRTAGRILFGRGMAAQAAGEIAALGTRVLLVRGGHGFADVLAGDLTAAGCAVLQIRGRGEPDLPTLEDALAQAHAFGPTVVVAVGGGSVIDLGKALAALVPAPGPVLDHLEVVGKGLPLVAAPLPFVALPTTAGTGAEVTKNAVIGVPDHARKVSLRDDRMLPDLALVDPALTDDCPRAVTLASGLDAVTQVIEPYLSAKANPMTDALCAAAIPRGLAALARLMQAEDAGARDDMALVSMCGGIALANAGLGAVHGLAGVIGGRYGAAHGAICGRLLVPVLRTNAAAMRAAGMDMARMAQVQGWIGAVFGADDPLARFQGWIDVQGLPRMADMAPGLAAAEVAQASAASSSMKGNPVPLDAETLVQLLESA
ncbi:iron-containing alcohol dehydrogenase [Rhodovulum adriaticum]|uniref:Uncharacterized protein n=1 Tax=Rhodovulum adriaticum TaxID=35804 RepID=A0A4R2NID3_RHOAD|nr:iron-containing alcohol dehydrogenase [Rhodovulum adriaticum]MBK1635796.1 alcohol dehydrogenase [Rhodovulum adriaticum]TCP21038.1 hypothetical protein EV656_11457 [Rhodovulum adriaticum]